MQFDNRNRVTVIRDKVLTGNNRTNKSMKKQQLHFYGFNILIVFYFHSKAKAFKITNN